MAEEARRMPIGGQAVIEGVLMKGKDLWGLAVRRPDGMIFRESWNNRPPFVALELQLYSIVKFPEFQDWFSV